MVYLKMYIANFLAVFFSNYLLPGIVVMDQTRLPHFGGEMIFALALGALNSIVFFALKMFGQRINLLKIALVILVLNFAAYGLLRWLPVGIVVEDLQGYLIAAGVVSVASFATNYFFEFKRHHHHHHPENM